MRVLIVLAIAALLVAATPAAAQSPKRVALVIGNDTYRSLSQLDNPRLDAGRLAGILAANGFEVVSCDGRRPGCFDLDRATLLDALETLERKAQGAELALVFYAGHGGALESYKASLAISERMAKSNPTDNRWQQAVGGEHGKIAGVHYARGDRSAALAAWRKSLSIAETLATSVEEAETGSSGKPGAKTAAGLGNVAWHALFAREFMKALAASERASTLAPDLVWIDTNRAHALMLLKRTREARALYLAHKGKMSLSGLWDKAIAGDFERLRKAGLAHPMMPEIERALGVAPAPAGKQGTPRRAEK